jgi:hypothetical protein
MTATATATATAHHRQAMLSGHFARDCRRHSGETTGHDLPSTSHSGRESRALSWVEETCALHAAVSLTCMPISVLLVAATK